MVGILYESDEWSDWKLHGELEAALNEPVAMISMEAEDAPREARSCELLVSRIFASARFRGHERAAHAMERLTRGPCPPMINPARAHAFETSKWRAAAEMENAGLAVPRVQDLGTPSELAPRTAGWSYPAVIKPDCGGRTTHTAVLHGSPEALAFLGSAPPLLFIVEDFIPPRAGFMTRVELVDGAPALVVRRSIAPSGLSSYHEGSAYSLYPDCPRQVLEDTLAAARALDIEFGSFDVMESTDGRAYMIDANSVSNVSEDCTELFGGFDLMHEYARALCRRVRKARRQSAGRDTMEMEKEQC